jgi:23S rRNA pseudouridine1911/1915/1917 synthase
MRLDVLFVDNHLLAVAKPAGLGVVPDESGDESLLDVAKAWLKREYDKPGDVFLGVVHRLDRPVSGVVLFARTSKAASRLSEQFRTRAAHKLYFGVARDAPREDQGTLEQWLSKDEHSNRVRVVDERTAGAQLARTTWRVVARERGAVQLDLIAHTGRPHQLRVALASLGCPLLGDLKYGAERPLPDKSIALHAGELEVEHPTLRTPLAVRCPPPPREWWSFRTRGA